MTSAMPFIVPIGDLPEKFMKNISKSLSITWGGKFVTVSANQSPNETISSLPSIDGLVQFVGDVAMMHPSGGSWLEALAAWKIPVVLIVLVNQSGEIPGIAYSYVALCKQLKVPLIGIVQLGEPWKTYERKLDGLPWCGYLSSKLWNDNSHNKSIDLLEDLVAKLKIQVKYICKSFIE